MNASYSIAATLSIYEEMALNLLEQLPDAWVIDNGSNPSISKAITKYRIPLNLWFTGGWNRAMQFIKANNEPYYVWMLNDDLRGVAKDIQLSLMEYLAFHPAVAAVTPAFNSPHQIFHKRSEAWGKIRKVSWIDWTCPMVSMEAWEDIGPFDEDFKGYGADIDWCYRAKEKGWEFAVIDSWDVVHMGSYSTTKLGAQAIMSNVMEMERLLCNKWGKSHWYDFT